MKAVIRFFNVIIMALSAAAAAFLFLTTSFSFNSKISIDVDNLTKFVPETEYTSTINIPQMLGTNKVDVSIKFSLDLAGLQKAMKGDKKVIDDNVITKSVQDVVDTLHEPIDLITEFTIRSVIKSTLHDEIKKQVEAAKDSAHSESTADEIMDEAGMNDKYFTNFSNALYDSADETDATVESVSNVLFWQIDEALEKAEAYGVDKEKFGDDKKAEIQASLEEILNQLQLVEEGGKLKRISQVSYIYLSSYLKTELQSKVSDPTVLEQASGETIPHYADRLLGLQVLSIIPSVFYQVVGYVSLALFIGIFVFAGIWGLLFIITLIKTFTRKPWTIFGPWFWILGSLQLVLGVGLTVFGKFILPRINIPLNGLPVTNLILSPRTYAFIPSMIYLACIVLAIIYAILRGAAKRQMKKEEN